MEVFTTIILTCNVKLLVRNGPSLPVFKRTLIGWGCSWFSLVNDIRVIHIPPWLDKKLGLNQKKSFFFFLNKFVESYISESKIIYCRITEKIHYVSKTCILCRVYLFVRERIYVSETCNTLSGSWGLDRVYTTQPKYLTSVIWAHIYQDFAKTVHQWSEFRSSVNPTYKMDKNKIKPMTY